MSDYQRLVSYIYSYPGGTRDKNVGFAKAEVRNGQFKLNVSLKGVYTDAPETFGVHLLIEDGEKSADGVVLLPVGNVIVNGGSGQYADLLNPSDISGSGYRFEDISGIAVARQDNDYYRMFSLWKDMQIKPELVRFLPKDYRKPEIIQRNKMSESSKMSARDEETVREVRSEWNRKIEENDRSLENNNIEIEKNKYGNFQLNKEMVSEQARGQGEAGSKQARGQAETGSKQTVWQESSDSASAIGQIAGAEAIEEQRRIAVERTAEKGSVSEKTAEENGVSAAESVPAEGAFMQAGGVVSDVGSSSVYENVQGAQPSNTGSMSSMGSVSSMSGVGSGDMTEPSKMKKSVPGEMGGIFDNADFIDVFGDDYYYDCVEVTPEQLQRLPIEDKAVVSNSFLEHGYYNFKHLLFGRVRENERHTKYFIGVPGMYCNRERFMATMFGYGNFKRSHRADCSNPYFGYWYQEI